jgi:hypothetical protein
MSHPLTWTKIDPCDTEYNDQAADLGPGLWAEIGPDHPDGWTWTILEDHGTPVCAGLSVSESQAKRDVVAWLDAQVSA